jgi:hypothetical protein
MEGAFLLIKVRNHELRCMDASTGSSMYGIVSP